MSNRCGTSCAHQLSFSSFRRLLPTRGDMITRKLRDGDIALLNRFLHPHTDASMILLSNMRACGLKFENRPFHGDYFGAFARDGNICGVLAHYWNGNLLMQAPDASALTALFRRLTDETLRSVTSVVGPHDQALNAIRELALEDAEYANDQAESLFSVDLASEFRPAVFDAARLRMIEAAEPDGPTLFEWLMAYDVEVQGKVSN